ncbi:MAG: hypothetical protein D6762_04950, partial [Candidatus Neomarinimicrobiota bacterium]
PLSSPVQQNWNGALHWMHYPKEFSKGWESRLRYSVGTYGSGYTLQSGERLIEGGFTSGIGIKFGITDNSLDFNYSFGWASAQQFHKSTIQKFSLHINLSDIWFVKRREI